MKAIQCILLCYTSCGGRCLKAQFPSIKEAKNQGKWMVNEGYAFSCEIVKNTI